MVNGEVKPRSSRPANGRANKEPGRVTFECPSPGARDGAGGTQNSAQLSPAAAAAAGQVTVPKGSVSSAGAARAPPSTSVHRWATVDARCSRQGRASI